MYHQSDLIVNNVSFSSRYDFEYYDYDNNNNDNKKEEAREMKRIKDYLCNSVINMFTKTNDTIILNDEKKEEAIEHVDEDAYNGQILYANMTTVLPRVSSSSPAEVAVAMAGLRHNHTYLGTGDNLASGSGAGGLGSYESGSINNENSMIELHPYSYKSKMLKRIQKTRLNIKGENGSSSSSSSSGGGQDALSRANQSRDEQALRDAHIELSIEEVVDSSADEFNDLIRVNEFTPEQVNLLKDIRRRGKNKVAAQICRKRKLDSIDSLRAKVDDLKSVKSELISEYNAIHDEVSHLYLKAVDCLFIIYVLSILNFS